MRTIALYTTETMADWEYAYLTTQIAGAEQLKPGRFRLLLVGDGLAPVVTDRGVTTASGIHAIPFTAEVMRITGLVPDAMVDAREQVFLSAREDDYMALMEATATWQNS